MLKTYKYKISLTKLQIELIENYFRYIRFIFNYFFEIFTTQGRIEGQKAVSQADGALKSNIIDKDGNLKKGKNLDNFKAGQEASVRMDIANSEALGESVKGKIKVKDTNGKEKEVDIDKNLESLMMSPSLLKNREMFANSARMAERFGAIDENGNIDINQLTSGKIDTVNKKDALKQSIKQAESKGVISNDMASKLLESVDNGDLKVSELNKDIISGNKKQQSALKTFKKSQKTMAEGLAGGLNELSYIDKEDKNAISEAITTFANTGQMPTNLNKEQQKVFKGLLDKNKGSVSNFQSSLSSLNENTQNLKQLDFMRNVAAKLNGDNTDFSKQPVIRADKEMDKLNHNKHQAQKEFWNSATDTLNQSNFNKQEKSFVKDALKDYRQKGSIDYDKLGKKHNLSESQLKDFKSDTENLLNSGSLSESKKHLDTARNDYNSLKEVVPITNSAIDLGEVSQIAGVTTKSTPITRGIRKEAENIINDEKENSTWYRSQKQGERAKQITNSILNGEKFTQEELHNKGFSGETIDKMVSLQNELSPQTGNATFKDKGISFKRDNNSDKAQDIVSKADEINNNSQISLLDLADNQGKKKADSFIGESAGTKANFEKNDDMYIRNANYSEQQKNQTTDAKITAQGGIKSAVATDTRESSLKATQQQKGLEGQVAALMSASGVDSKDAKELSKAIIEGSQKGAEEFKKALQTAGNVAQFQSQGKTAADAQRTVGLYANAEDYAEVQKISATKQEIPNKALASYAFNDEAKNQTIQKEMERMKAASPQKLEEYKKEGLEYGFLEQDENGNIVATKDASKFIAGRSAMNANGMVSNDAGVIAGMKMNTQYNALTGEAVVTLNDVNKIESGDIAVSNLSKPTTLAGANAQETTNILTSPSKWAETIAGKVGDATSGEENGLATGLLAGAGIGVGLWAASDAITTHKNKQNGKFVNTNTGEKVNTSNLTVDENGHYFDRQGNTVLGNDGKPLTTDNIRPERSAGGEVVRSGWNGVRNTINGLNNPFTKDSFDSSNNNGTNNGNNGNSDSTKSQINDNSTHNNTPFNSDNGNGNTHSQKNQELSQLKETNNQIKGLKTSAPEILNDMLNEKDSEIDEKVNKGEITPKEAQHKKASINNARVLATNSNSVSVSDLQSVGINSKDLKEKGFVVENNDKGFPHKVNLEDSTINFEMSKQEMLNSNQEKMDTTKSSTNKSVMKHSIGKSIAKKIPGVGAALTVADVASDLASGIASTVPVVGTAASFAIDGLNSSRGENTMKGVSTSHNPQAGMKGGFKKAIGLGIGGAAAIGATGYAMFGTEAGASEDLSQFNGTASSGGYMGGSSSTPNISKSNNSDNSKTDKTNETQTNPQNEEIKANHSLNNETNKTPQTSLKTEDKQLSQSSQDISIPKTENTHSITSTTNSSIPLNSSELPKTESKEIHISGGNVKIEGAKLESDDKQPQTSNEPQRTDRNEIQEPRTSEVNREIPKENNQNSVEPPKPQEQVTQPSDIQTPNIQSQDRQIQVNEPQSQPQKVDSSRDNQSIMNNGEAQKNDTSSVHKHSDNIKNDMFAKNIEEASNNDNKVKKVAINDGGEVVATGQGNNTIDLSNIGLQGVSTPNNLGDNLNLSGLNLNIAGNDLGLGNSSNTQSYTPIQEMATSQILQQPVPELNNSNGINSNNLGDIISMLGQNTNSSIPSSPISDGIIQESRIDTIKPDNTSESMAQMANASKINVSTSFDLADSMEELVELQKKD